MAHTHHLTWPSLSAMWTTIGPSSPSYSYRTPSLPYSISSLRSVHFSLLRILYPTLPTHAKHLHTP